VRWSSRQSLFELSSMEAELGSKRLALLLNIIPRLARVAVLGAKTDPFTTPYVEDFQNAATHLGLQLQPLLVDGPLDFEEAFAEMSARCAQAAVIQPLFQPHTISWISRPGTASPSCRAIETPRRPVA
jgi:putative tryptophan/tyrosine transport system substrate-binding protein